MPRSLFYCRAIATRKAWLRVHQVMRALGGVGNRELDALAWPLNALPVGQSNDLELTSVEIGPVV